MTKLDQFQSMFLSADKTALRYKKLAVKHVLVVSDLDGDAAAELSNRVRTFISVVDDESTQWARLDGGTFSSVKQLLDNVDKQAPDLIVTYRHLHSSAWQWAHSLGEHLDVLTQATRVPVVVLPHPDANRTLPHSLQNTNRVMAITDHLTGDARLINHALRFTQPGGSCWLTHVEPRAAFDRTLDAIAKIPEIDTELARELIGRQLLKDPRDYIRACRRTIDEQSLRVALEEIVTMGWRLAEYHQLIEDHDIDLLVF
ncbi:MAG: hypothetical protein VB674_09325, partial [Vicinamibacterales bacterium]